MVLAEPLAEKARSSATTTPTALAPKSIILLQHGHTCAISELFNSDFYTDWTTCSITLNDLQRFCLAFFAQLYAVHLQNGNEKIVF